MKSLVIALALVVLSAVSASAQSAGTCYIGLFGSNTTGGTVQVDAAGDPVATSSGGYANTAKLQVAVSPSGSLKACNGVVWTVTASAAFLVNEAVAFSQRSAATLQGGADVNTGAARSGSFTLTAVPTPGVTPAGVVINVYKATVAANQAGQ